MAGAEGVGESEIDQFTELRSRFGPEQRIVRPGLRIVNVVRGRDHVVVAGKHQRFLECQQPVRMVDQPVHPVQLQSVLGVDGFAVGK